MIPPVEIQGRKTGSQSGQYTLMIIGGSNDSKLFGGKGVSERIADRGNAVDDAVPLLFTRLESAIARSDVPGPTAAEYYADCSPGCLGRGRTIEYCEALLLHDDVYSTARRWLRVGADPETSYPGG